MIETLRPFTPEESADPSDRLLNPEVLDRKLGADVLRSLDFEPSELTFQPLLEEAPFGLEGVMQTAEELPERRGPINPRSSKKVWTDDPDNPGQGSWDRDNDPEGD